MITSYLLKVVLHNPGVLGRMMQWAVKVGEFRVEYQPQSAIKSQVLVDFIAEFTWMSQEVETKVQLEDLLVDPNGICKQGWTIHAKCGGLCFNEPS